MSTQILKIPQGTDVVVTSIDGVRCYMNARLDFDFFSTGNDPRIRDVGFLGAVYEITLPNLSFTVDEYGFKPC